MRFSLRHVLNRLAGIAVFGVAASLPTAAATITFDHDSPGFKPLGFESVDSPLVTFSILFALPSFHASNLFISNGPTTHNSNALELSGYIPDQLIMDFAVPVTALGFDFGGDSGGGVPPVAVLKLFSGMTEVGQVNSPSNGNRVVDQSLVFTSAAPFNRAVFSLEEDGAEVVDNIRFEEVPEPGSGILAILGILTGAGLISPRVIMMRNLGPGQDDPHWLRVPSAKSAPWLA